MSPLDRTRLGIHLFVWGADWYDSGFDLARVLHHCRALGFAGVEFPWLERLPDATLRCGVAALRAEGLWATMSTALPPEACLVDGERAAEAVEWLRVAAEAAAAIGSPVLAGPLLAPVGELPGHAARGWETAADPLRRAAEHAASIGVQLCLEPLNRFETDTVNTLAQGAAVCRAVGPALRLLSDTFHQNIEEADPVGTLRAHLPWIGHAHFSENHRGPAGSGHIPWAQIVAALEAGAYGGRVVVEGFNGRVRALARATCIWRPVAASPDEFAERSALRLLALMG